ncbi:MAG TPA: V-type ATP synthase subunit E family protein [Methanomicrobiales archaeon]|jgi:V/A-type H+-transporting ATPase subunit E|nr:V-type ATP synthase subunit E family protein [Methanomicrobiales archaeon]
MELEAVALDIRDKAKRDAAAIREETRKETDRILSSAQERVREINLGAEDEVNRQAARMTELEVSSANLAVKRMHLNTQKDLLDQVYRATLDAIGRNPESFRRDTVKTLLSKARKDIREGAVFCSARDTQALQEILRSPEYAGFRFGGTVDIPGGIIIESGNGQLKVDYSYRTFLDRVWEAGLKDASDTLFQ